MLIKKIFSNIVNKKENAKPVKTEEKPKQRISGTDEVCSKTASNYAQTMFIAGQNIDLSDLDADDIMPEESPEEHEERVDDLAASVLLKVCPNNYYGDYKEEITMKELAEKEVSGIAATGAEVEEIADYLQIAKEAQGKLENIALNDPRFFDKETVALAHEYLEELVKLLSAELSE